MSTELQTFDENKGMFVVKQNSRLDDSLFSKELAPHYMQLSKQLASSELVPKSFRGKPQDLFICWAMGYQVGLTPEQSMQCIAVINGKPAMWGDDMLALCIAHKDFEDIIEDPIHQTGGVNVIVGYRCTVKRRGMQPKSNEFTLDMAKKAGLLGKVGPWTQYPERMLKLRARGFSLRDAFPDALKGIKPREEVEDYIDTEYKVVQGSRTEFLKNDLQNKKDENAPTTDNTSIDLNSLMADLPPSEEASRVQKPEALGESREQENTVSAISFMRPEQAKYILKLLKEKEFTPERTGKMLEYYEIKEISQLTSDAADHLIAKLTSL